MIRHMQLLDAQATIVQNLTTNEQRMIINSKCGSKFVTMICKQFFGTVPSIIFMQAHRLQCRPLRWTSH